MITGHIIYLFIDYLVFSTKIHILITLIKNHKIVYQNNNKILYTYSHYNIKN